MTLAAALTGVVLAGGASRRMGTDKALLRLDGERLVERVAARLEVVCERVLVASGDGRRLRTAPRWREVADPIPDAGPLAGILAGLREATSPLVAVAAVDLPHTDPEVLACLRDLWGGEAAVVPRVGARVQPLHAVWSVEHREAVAAALVAGERSPVDLLGRLDVRVAGPEVWGELSDGRFARNVNDPAEARAMGIDPGPAGPSGRLPGQGGHQA